MYNNPYMYGQQSINDRIDNQIAQLQQMKDQLKNQQPAINQTFQLAPHNLGGLRYFNTIDEVNKEPVYNETPFFSKDMSVLWIKNNKGEVKVYELNEIVPKDNKDLMIESLQEQVNELKGMIENATNDAVFTNDDTEQNATNTTKYDETNGKEFKSNKSTGLSKISGSKKK